MTFFYKICMYVRLLFNKPIEFLIFWVIAGLIVIIARILYIYLMDINTGEYMNTTESINMLLSLFIFISIAIGYIFNIFLDNKLSSKNFINMIFKSITFNNFLFVCLFYFLMSWYVSPIILPIFYYLLPNGIVVDILGNISKFHKILQPLGTMSKTLEYHKSLPYIKSNRVSSLIICKSILNIDSPSNVYSKPLIYNKIYICPITKVNILSNIAGKIVNSGVFKQNTINGIVVKDSNILSSIYNKDIFIKIKGNSKEYINFVQLSSSKAHYSNILDTYLKYNIMNIQHNNKNYYLVLKCGITSNNTIDIIDSIKKGNILGVGEEIKIGVNADASISNIANNLSLENNIKYNCNYFEFNIPSKKSYLNDIFENPKNYNLNKDIIVYMQPYSSTVASSSGSVSGTGTGTGSGTDPYLISDSELLTITGTSRNRNKYINIELDPELLAEHNEKIMKYDIARSQKNLKYEKYEDLGLYNTFYVDYTPHMKSTRQETHNYCVSHKHNNFNENSKLIKSSNASKDWNYILDRITLNSVDIHEINYKNVQKMLSALKFNLNEIEKAFDIKNEINMSDPITSVLNRNVIANILRLFPYVYIEGSVVNELTVYELLSHINMSLYLRYASFQTVYLAITPETRKWCVVRYPHNFSLAQYKDIFPDRYNSFKPIIDLIANNELANFYYNPADTGKGANKLLNTLDKFAIWLEQIGLYWSIETVKYQNFLAKVWGVDLPVIQIDTMNGYSSQPILTHDTIVLDSSEIVVPLTIINPKISINVMNISMGLIGIATHDHDPW